MKKTIIGVIAVLLVLLTVIGCGQTEVVTEEEPEGTPWNPKFTQERYNEVGEYIDMRCVITEDLTTSCSEISNGKIEETKEPIIEKLQIFEGTQDTVTDPFYLEKGFVKITGHYIGDSNFAVYLIGDGKRLIFNEINSYDGKVAEIVGGGYYRLEVRAASWNSRVAWSITLEQ